ncbi:MAG: hypothetical protein ACI9R3_001528 [Verrucomicrobiales bacterium]|jgi:hypothetical protein
MEESSNSESKAAPVDDGAPIECPVAKWYYKRMGLMFLMLFAMGCWFLYDATIGYPGKKEIWDRYTEMTGYDLQIVDPMSSTDALPDSGKLLAIIGKSERGEHYRVFDGDGEQKVNSEGPPTSAKKTTIKKLADVLKEKSTAGSDLESDDKQDVLGALSRVLNVSLKGSQSDSDGMDGWNKLAKEEGWELEPEEYTDSKIETQWHFTIGMFVASLIAVLIFLLNRGKVLKADADSFYTPSGGRVAFADVFRIDRRKWDHKGLAYAMYREGGEGRSRKATIDDLKFLGADKVLHRLLKNFEGELIDRIPDEDEEEEANGASNDSDIVDAESVDVDGDESLETPPESPKS